MLVQRADARRNYARLLAVAAAEIAAHGADASMEQIARTAGVGSGTVRRHFPSRRALLEAVFRDQVATLSALASDLTGRADPRAALLEWLSAVTESASTMRGLAVAIALDLAANPGPAEKTCASAQLTAAGEPLVRRAARDGAVAPGVTVGDLLALITGIALATEHHPDQADRLLALTVAGISPDQGVTSPVR
jgi:AcrR family transcriptional regulator